jgi:hypothetical protein
MDAVVVIFVCLPREHSPHETRNCGGWRRRKRRRRREMEDWTGMGNAGGAYVDSRIDGEVEVIAAVSKFGSRQWWWWWWRRQWQWRQSASSLPDVGGGGRSGGRAHHG